MSEASGKKGKERARYISESQQKSRQPSTPAIWVIGTYMQTAGTTCTEKSLAVNRAYYRRDRRRRRCVDNSEC